MIEESEKLKSILKRVLLFALLCLCLNGGGLNKAEDYLREL